MATRKKIKPQDMDTKAVASAICESNPQLVTWIYNTEMNFKPLNARLTRMASSISAKYADGSFIPSKVLNRLTWDIINTANGETDEFDIEI